MKTNTVIYSLSDPETNRVKFLGVAANIEAVHLDLEQRRTGTRRFVNQSNRLEEIQCEGWLRELFKAGLMPLVKLEAEAALEDSDKVFKQLVKSLTALGHPVWAARPPGRPVLADVQVGADAATARRLKHRSVITAAKNRIGRIKADIEMYEEETARMRQAKSDQAEGKPLPIAVAGEIKFYDHLIADYIVKVQQSRSLIETANQRIADAQAKLDAIAAANLRHQENETKAN